VFSVGKEHAEPGAETRFRNKAQSKDGCGCGCATKRANERRQRKASMSAAEAATACAEQGCHFDLVDGTLRCRCSFKAIKAKDAADHRWHFAGKSTPLF